MSKRIFILAVIASLLIFSANAQLLWKVEGNGLTKPSYLFGTHHLIEKEQIPGFENVLTYINSVDAVVGELDMSDMLNMQMHLMKAAIMKDTTLSDLISPEDYTLVDAEFKNVIGFGLKPLEKMKPMMLSTMYSGVLYMKLNNMKKEPEAVDQVIQKIGKKANKKFIGLETLDEQIDILFNHIPLKRQAEILVKTVKEKEESMDMTKRLNSAYIAGDLEQLQVIYTEDDDMSNEERKILVEQRNNNWVEQFKTIFAENSCFVAVGCLHLSGKAGIINQLQNAGYTIKAVKY
ncbi:MAG: TraB/GumN family protein [Paludibacter sp.]